MDKKSVYRTNIIGAGEVGVASLVDMDKNVIHKTNSFFWDYTSFIWSICLRRKLPTFWRCLRKKDAKNRGGSGQSLQYLGERKASELWGTDISEKQIEKTRQLLTERGLSAKLICSPMEEKCSIPEDYFDFVYSVYAIG